MQRSITANQSCQRPPIADVIGQYVTLKRIGRQLSGLCPFHAEKTPSFLVNPEKEVFYCHGCHVGGDVVAFVMRADGLTFPEALRTLGIDTPEQPALSPNRLRAAKIVAAWAREQRAKLNTMIADSLECRDIADEANDSELGERFDRERYLLSQFYESLESPRGIVELLAVRDSIENITADAGGSL